MILFHKKTNVYILKIKTQVVSLLETFLFNLTDFMQIYILISP